MFRGLKKRVKSFGESRGGANRSNHENGNTLDTPRRTVSGTSSSSSVEHAANKNKAVLRNNNNKAKSNGGDDMNNNDKDEEQHQTKHLAAFDKCIETSDNITASSSAGQHDTVLLSRHAPGAIPDCSLLVSPDGDLLLVPTGVEKQQDLFKTTITTKSSEAIPSKASSSRTVGSSSRENGANGKTDVEESTTDAKAQVKKRDDGEEDLDTTDNDEEATANGEQSSACASDDEKSSSDNEDDSDDDDDDDDDVELNPTTDTSHNSTSSFSELMLHGKDDYQSAVFLGNDLHPSGDKALNRFSARGWSIPATSLALQQTGHSLNALAHFCEQMVLSRKESAARTTIACDNLRSEAAIHTNGAAFQSMAANQWEIIDPRATDFDLTPARTGPLQAEHSTLRAATAVVEHYHNMTAEKESRRWRMASLQRNGVLPAMHTATDQFHERYQNRQLALEETSRRAHIMEDRLVGLKKQAEKKWKAVYKAEERVNRRLEELLTARSRERQNARLKQLREDEIQRRAAAAAAAEQQQQQQGADSPTGESSTEQQQQQQQQQPMSDEVWDIVSSLADGSFEPMSIPTVTSDAASAVSDEASTTSSINLDANKEPLAAPLPPPLESSMPVREQVEQELKLPELRQAALKADEEIQDVADALLNILSTLDTTRRSARIAAETCMVAAANAQAACLRSMVKLERASLEERLRDLDGLDEVLDKIDVRADLDAYITSDKKERGGSSHLRDDDDGGIASALAILSSHVDGSQHADHDGLSGGGNVGLTDESEEFHKASPDKLNELIERLFERNAAFDPDASVSDEATIKARSEYESNVDFLCKSAAKNSGSARARRSAMCYALNAKRSQNARIETTIQFDGLCKVFSAILTGCHAEDGGVTNAKMCMMLAQTFYFERESSVNEIANGMDDSTASSPSRQARKRRVFVKSSLVNHEIWSKDEFWDSALSQQISESLAHSGVLSNFERNRQETKRPEWAQTRKTKWYDLTYTERIEAASQVHAVVFAQLSALAHSMIEFGCGLERSCAFVRRMSIRNQLPSSQRTMLLMHLVNRNEKGK